MPETPDHASPRNDESGSLLLRALYDEQLRLRGEVERLRSEQGELQQKLNQKTSGGEDNDQGQQEKKDQDQNSDKEKEGEGEKNGDKGNKGKDEDKQDQGDKKKDEKKEPANKKAEHWAKAHPIGVILIAVGLVVLVIAGILIWRYVSSYENTDDAQVDGHTDPISARISGFVLAAYVENTNHVKKGQVLVDLDPRDYKVALAQAQANLAQAIASLNAQSPNVPITQTTQATTVTTSDLSVESAQASLASAEHSYQSALSDLTQTEATAANAAREEERYRQLVGKQEVSKEQYDQQATNARALASSVESRRQTADAARNSVQQARSALDQARKRAEEARQNRPRQIEIQHATLAVRLANVETAKAQVEQASLNLSYCKIVAPDDGIIGDKSVQVGSQVTAGQELLALTQINDIWVTANFKETQTRNIRPGQSVTIHVDSLSQDFDGFVEALPGGTGAIYSLLPPENATGNYVKVVQRLPVRIRFKPNQPHAERLHPGLSVEPKVWIK